MPCVTTRPCATCRSGGYWSTPPRRSWPRFRRSWGATSTTCLCNEASICGCNTRLEKVVDGRVTLSDGTDLDTGLLVWTAGIKADPIVAHFGLPLDEQGRVRVGPTLQVDGHDGVWALGGLCVGAERRHSRSGRPPDQPTRSAPGPPVDGEPHSRPGGRHTAPVSVPLPRPGGYPRADRGHSGSEGGEAERFARMVGGSRRPSHAGSRCLPPAWGPERLDPGPAVPPQPGHAVGNHRSSSDGRQPGHSCGRSIPVAFFTRRRVRTERRSAGSAVIQDLDEGSYLRTTH